MAVAAAVTVVGSGRCWLVAAGSESMVVAVVAEQSSGTEFEALRAGSEFGSEEVPDLQNVASAAD